MKTLTTILFAMLSVSCATGYKVQSIDTSLQAKGQVNGRTVGLNDKKEIILQEEVQADDEMRIMLIVNDKFEFDLGHEIHMVNRCRKELSDPRLGGNGELPTLSKMDGLKTPEQIKEEIGITDEGDIKVVKKTYFIDALKAQKRYKITLEKMIVLSKEQREECEYKMGNARMKAGLPSARFEGDVYERSLDEAFEIQARRKSVVDSH
jgi:hypothetical protein